MCTSPNESRRTRYRAPFLRFELHGGPGLQELGHRPGIWGPLKRSFRQDELAVRFSHNLLNLQPFFLSSSSSHVDELAET
jgi:hypothetical protein